MPAPFAAKGSRRWLQIAVNRAAECINQPIRHGLKLPDTESIEWLSPLQQDGFVEYRDGRALTRLGVRLLRRPLSGFWPTRGPVWDGLALTDSGACLLIEAKAHIPEMLSPASKAVDLESKKLIRSSLRQVQRTLAPRATRDWSTLEYFYQYTNRLAFLHLLQTLNDEPAHLINVYFVNATDMGGPSTSEEWQGAIALLECYLGIRHHRLAHFVHPVFVDVAHLPKVAS
jgi:hypothetical protein